MYDDSLIAKIENVVGFENYWDLVEIPDLGAGLTTSESGQYFHQFNSNVKLNYILPSIAQGRDHVEYLTQIRKAGINAALNAVATEKQLENVGKALASEDVVMNIGNNTVIETNEGHFVGVAFCVKDSTGIRATINRVGLYLTTAVTDLDLYLFHSTQEQVVQKFKFTTTKNNSFSWEEITRALDYDDGLITGGTWYFGYYQDDLGDQGSQGIGYSNMNWKDGYCGGCGDNGLYQSKYDSIRSRVTMQGFYVQGANLPNDKDERFNIGTPLFTNSSTWGFNFHVTISCNLSQFWYENRLKLKKVIGLQVCMMILLDMRSSPEINNIQQNLLVNIVRDLEGPADTQGMPLWKQLKIAIKALILDEGNLGKDCIPCARKPRSRLGAIG